MGSRIQLSYVTMMLPIKNVSSPSLVFEQNLNASTHFCIITHIVTRNMFMFVHPKPNF